MKAYATESIRNLAVIGHGDAGKTQLISSLLFVAGATPRWGKVEEGTTVTDYEEDSIARKITLNTALAHLGSSRYQNHFYRHAGICGLCRPRAPRAARCRLCARRR